MRVVVWQWGRRGAGPRFAAELAESLRALPGHAVLLSLSRQAELLRQPNPPDCDLPIATYDGPAGFLLRCALAPFRVRWLRGRLAAWKPDVAICAMPGPLDLLMAAALRRAGVPFLVVVHDADLHPGDGLPFQMPLQHALMRRASGLIALSTHVRDRLLADGRAGVGRLILSSHPPLRFGPTPPPALAHDGRMRLLSFGRLLPYKGLDLLAEALRLLGPRDDFVLRVVGQGPDSPELAALAALPGVEVENRWVPEGEIGALLAWSDAMVLSHREASQSGPAAAAIAAGRWVIAPRVGGLAEQLAGERLARLCEPTPASLAAAIAALLDERPDAGEPGCDAATAWRAMAGTLSAAIATRLAGRAR
jgi:glycosyltransferase involved in cell wall biosynthesis